MSERGDVIDQACALEEQLTAAAINAARVAYVPRINGICLYCDEPTSPSTHFCDKDCAADYERHLAAQRRNGNPARTHLEK